MTTQTTCQPYAQLIDQKRWADRGLHAAVAEHRERLGDEDQSLLRLVLDHILTVDRIFQHHLQGLPHGYTAARSETLPTLEALEAGAREVDAWYAGYIRSLSAEALKQPVDFVFTSGKPARMRRSEILLHVCLHGSYHRGNAGALLQLRGLKPSPDAITDYLEDAA
jgi:uncharacterized damage-inducible protein DinB